MAVTVAARPSTSRRTRAGVAPSVGDQVAAAGDVVADSEGTAPDLAAVVVAVDTDLVASLLHLTGQGRCLAHHGAEQKEGGPPAQALQAVEDGRGG